MTRLTIPKLTIFGAAAIAAAALASPAMAQEVIYNPGYCAQFYPNANCQNKGPGNPYTGDYQRQTQYGGDRYRRSDVYYNGQNDRRNNGWHDSWNDDRWDRSHTGFWPGDVAADTVGAAVGTAGAIATAPFRAGGAYAYDNGYYHDGDNSGWNQSYAERNGSVCSPGTWFKGEDGRRRLCQ
jgi:hypothetical protein